MSVESLSDADGWQVCECCEEKIDCSVYGKGELDRWEEDHMCDACRQYERDIEETNRHLNWWVHHGR